MIMTRPLFVALLLIVTACGVGQTISTNKMTRAEAARLASRLPLGIREGDMYRFMETNGLTAGFTIGGIAVGTWMPRIESRL
jgi:hypothetical protein